jgi:5-methylthioribose kinase
MTGTQIDAENVGAYLRRHGVIPAGEACHVESLGGGVSNVVLRVETERTALVVKQPLANLAVDEDWPADLTRVHNEAAAARAFSDAADAAVSDTAAGGVSVPDIVFEHERDHVIAMESAPTTCTMWKSRLLEGDVDVDVARTLGRFLGLSHERTRSDPALAERFENDAPFEQLRLDPYHRTVAQRHPDVAPLVRAEIERIEDCRRALVHGDFSPKNVLVEGEESAGDRALWLLDFEVAHWGDPAFDVAFMLNHLCIKAVFNDDRSTRYLDAAQAFWRSYCETAVDPVEADVVRELGILMLARVDGKSPVEYVTENGTKETLRTIAKRSLREECTTIDGFSTLVTEETSNA